MSKEILDIFPRGVTKVSGFEVPHEERFARMDLNAASRKIGDISSPGTNGLYRVPGTSEQWGTRHALAVILTEEGTPLSCAGLGNRIKRRMPSAPTMPLSLPGGTYTGYRHEDIHDITADLALIKIFLTESGIYIDEFRKKWATTTAMKKEFNLSKTAIERRLPGVSSQLARNNYGKPTAIFDFDSVKERLRPLLAAREQAREDKEIKVDKDGRYMEAPLEEGETSTIWITLNAFYDELPDAIKEKTSTSALRRYADKTCRSQKAIDRHVRAERATIYPLDELSDLSIVKNEVRVADDGIFIDEEGEEWASGRTWRDIYDVSQKALDRGIMQVYESWADVPSIKGFGLAKREDPLYPNGVIEKALSYILEADNLEVNGITTQLNESPNGLEETIYATVEEIQAIIPEEVIPRYTYRRKFKAHRVDSINRIHGGEVATFNLNKIIDHFRDRITAQLDQIATQSTDAEPTAAGRLISLSAYLTEHPEKDKKQLIADTDMITRQRRLTANGQITYLYQENDLDEISKAA